MTTSDSQVQGSEDTTLQPAPGETQQGNSQVSMEELLKAIDATPELEDALRRKYQSQKDKAVANANRTANEAKTMVERLLERLDAPEQEKLRKVQQDILLDDLYAERYGVPSQPAEAGNPATVETVQPSGRLNMTQAFKDSGYDMGGLKPEDIAFAQSFQGTQSQLTDQLLIRKVGGTPNPSPNAIGVASSGAPPLPKTGPTEAELSARYHELRVQPRNRRLADGRTVHEHVEEVLKQMREGGHLS